MPTQVNLSNNQDIDGILWGWKWDTTNLTYSFPQNASEYANYTAIQGFQAFNAIETNVAVYAINQIDSFSGLSFTFTNTAGAGNIRFAMTGQVQYTTNTTLPQDKRTLHIPGNDPGTAEGNPPDPSQVPDYAQGDAWFTTRGIFNNVEFGQFFWTEILHEIGHTLGLKHGHSQQVGHGVNFPTLPADHNSQEYSVMTYNGNTTGFGFNTDEYPQTYMQDDIAALQYMYGADYGAKSNNTDSYYKFSPTTGEMTINGASTGVPFKNYILRTVWDGGGNDTYDFSAYGTDVQADLRPGKASTPWTGQLADLNSQGSAAFARGEIYNALLFNNDTRSLIENAVGGSGNDYMTGNQANNTLIGNDGNDALDGQDGEDNLAGGNGNDALAGGNGNDLLNGQAGADLMVGGAGNDSYFVDDIGDQVYETAGNGQDQVYAYLSYTLTDNVEWLLLQEGSPINGAGNGLSNAILGNSSDNIMLGYAGNDALVGAGGNDTLIGGVGTDVMAGGVGNDVYYVDNSADQCIENAGEGFDIIYATASFTMGANIEWLIQQDSGGSINATGNALANNISGNNYADVLNGGAGNDVILGNGGFDVLDGGTGDDVLAGGSDSDIYYVDSFGDQCIEFAGQGDGDTIYAATSYIAQDNIENLILQGAGANNIIGNSGSNGLVGNSADNILNGGAGVDFLQGNAGSDTFQFTPGQAAGDYIMDFGAQDKIQFIGYGAGAVFGKISASQGIVYAGNGSLSEVINFANNAAVASNQVQFI